MSHFAVLVIGENVEGQLAPYDENLEVSPYRRYVEGEDLERMVEHYGTNNIHELATHMKDWTGQPGEVDNDEGALFYWSTYNPQSKWDWYAVGGRWRGYWKLREHAKLVGAGVLGQPGIFNNAPEHDADQARKGDIDFEAMEAEARQRAVATWAKWESALHLPTAEPWQSFRERIETGELTPDQARSLYSAQPQVKAYKEIFPSSFMSGPEDLGTDREEYIDAEGLKSWVPFALVYRGQWTEKGHMGWFGMSTDKPEDQKPWAAEVRSLVLTLPDDELLTIVDCHI